MVLISPFDYPLLSLLISYSTWFINVLYRRCVEDTGFTTYGGPLWVSGIPVANGGLQFRVQSQGASRPGQPLQSPAASGGHLLAHWGHCCPHSLWPLGLTNVITGTHKILAPSLLEKEGQGKGKGRGK